MKCLNCGLEIDNNYKFCMNCGKNVDGNQTNEFIQEKKENGKSTTISKILLIIVTIFFDVIFCFLKCFTFGWTSFFLIVSGILPIYIVLYNIASISIARVISKNKIDYIRFFILSFAFLLPALTFADAGDDSSNIARIINFGSLNLLYTITFLTIVIFIIQSIIYIKIYKDKRIAQKNINLILCPSKLDEIKKVDKYAIASSVIGIIVFFCLFLMHNKDIISLYLLFLIATSITGLLFGVISSSKSLLKTFGIMLCIIPPVIYILDYIGAF